MASSTVPPEAPRASQRAMTTKSGVEVVLGVDGGLVLADGLLDGDDGLAHDVAAALGHRLVFDMNAGDAGADERGHGAADVDGVSEALVGVGDDGYVDGGGHAPRVLDHLGHGDEAGVGDSEDVGAGLRAGHVGAVVAGRLVDAGVEGTGPSGDDEDLAAMEELLQPCRLLHAATFPSTNVGGLSLLLLNCWLSEPNATAGILHAPATARPAPRN